MIAWAEGPMLIQSPVLVLYPPTSLLRVTVSCPSPQHSKEDIGQLLDGLSASCRAVVAGPTNNHRIQPSDEPFLVHVFVSANRSPEFLHVSLYCCFARFDDCLKTKWLSMTVRSSFSLTNWKLPKMKAQKVEPRFAFFYFQRMRDSSLAWFQFKAQPKQPL